MPGRKVFGGYCSNVHRKLDKPSKHTRVPCSGCGTVVVRLTSQLAKSGRAYCKRCSKNTGENHPKWKEGQYINPAGYRVVLFKGEYKLEHRLNWEIANVSCLLPEAHGTVVIHHINMEKADNRPENLAMLSNKIHGRIHRLIDARKFDEAKCILVNWLEQQAFFLLHSEHLDFIKRTPLEDILVGQ